MSGITSSVTVTWASCAAIGFSLVGTPLFVTAVWLVSATIGCGASCTAGIAFWATSVDSSFCPVVGCNGSSCNSKSTKTKNNRQAAAEKPTIQRRTVRRLAACSWAAICSIISDNCCWRRASRPACSTEASNSSRPGELIDFFILQNPFFKGRIGTGQEGIDIPLIDIHGTGDMLRIRSVEMFHTHRLCLTLRQLVNKFHCQF